MSRRVFIGLAVVLIAVLAYVIFTNDTLFVHNESVVVVGYSKYSQKWIDVKEGALSAGQKQGINVTAVACDSIHAVSDQIQLIEQAIEERADAIIIMPTDLSQLESTIEKVKHNNIELIIIDNYQQSTSFSLPRVGTSDVNLAEDLAKNISESKEGRIEIGCIFSYDDNGKPLAVYNQFVESMKKYDNVIIISETTSAIDENVAGAETEVMLNTCEVDYIVCFEETITKGAAVYLEKQIENEHKVYKKDTKVIGIGSVDDCAGFLEDDIVYSLAVQSYYNMGYLALQNYSENLLSDVYAAHYIILKEDLYNEEYQKILFRIN